MLAHLYIQRPGDFEIISEEFDRFMLLSPEELKEKCLFAQKQGFFGVHRQALQVIALFKAARKQNIPFSLQIDSDGFMEFNEE